MVSGQKDRNQLLALLLEDVLVPASMVSGQKDRNQAGPCLRYTESNAASMVSGQKDRNQTGCPRRRWIGRRRLNGVRPERPESGAYAHRRVAAPVAGLNGDRPERPESAAAFVALFAYLTFASMVSGQKDRNQALTYKRKAGASQLMASMVSGQKDRNQ